MAEEIFLEDDFLRQLMSVGEVDLLVAIPSYNHAATIGNTLQAIEESLRQNFIRERAVILNVDGGSRDGTREAFLQSAEPKSGQKGLASLRTVHRITSEYAGSPSAGKALRTAVAAADLVRAKACAVVSPGTTNVTPSWVANLLRPIYREQFDFVAPLYARNRFSGLLVRELLYPMSRAVFGRRVREVYADEWGFSGRLASKCLEQQVWNEEAVQTRPEAWMAITAMCQEFRCCQNFLGPKLAAAPGTSPDLVDAIRQTVGNLFWCMEANQGQWIGRTGSLEVPTFGPEHELCEEGLPANPEKIFELFRSGVNDLGPILSTILTADTSAQVKAIALLDAERFRYSAELWVRTLYEFAGSYHRAVLNRDHLVQALVPLYRGRLYSYLVEHAQASAEVMEKDSEMVSQEFERQKPYLVERWAVKN